MLAALRHTYGPIQERNLSSVTSVTILALTQVILKYTSALTLENNPTRAINAVSQAKHLATFSSTWRESTEINLMFEKNNKNMF